VSAGAMEVTASPYARHCKLCRNEVGCIDCDMPCDMHYVAILANVLATGVRESWSTRPRSSWRQGSGPCRL
jgi:hypothetical protein